ncbi:hypothetical protein JMG10_03520 [Nostoc ellipsosporum NOK]|nr:hypothetical protein [Nostoc ellipsosporum NOK]
MTDQDQLYIDGFNAGYTLSMHEPLLVKQILEATDKSKPYIEGLSRGLKQYQKELLLAEMKKITYREKGLER